MMQTATYSHADDLPAAVTYWTLRSLCLTAALILAAIMHNSAGSRATINLDSVVCWIVGICLAL